MVCTLWLVQYVLEEIISRDAALKITVHRSSAPVEVRHRLVWSPHVPLSEEEEEDQEVCNIMVTHGSDVSISIYEILLNNCQCVPL